MDKSGKDKKPQLDSSEPKVSDEDEELLFKTVDEDEVDEKSMSADEAKSARVVEEKEEKISDAEEKDLDEDEDEDEDQDKTEEQDNVSDEEDEDPSAHSDSSGQAGSGQEDDELESSKRDEDERRYFAKDGESLGREVPKKEESENDFESHFREDDHKMPLDAGGKIEESDYERRFGGEMPPKKHHIESQDDEEIQIRGFSPMTREQERGYAYQDNIGYTASKPKKKSMKKFLIWMSVLAVIALVVGWFATTTFFKSEDTQIAKEQIPVATTQPTATPVPTPTLTKSDWTIEVLNGSGIRGEAKKIADGLSALGYNVIKTGNAENNNFEKSEIRVKNAMKDKIDLLIADIGSVIKVATVSGEVEDSTASAQIIIGKE